MVVLPAGARRPRHYANVLRHIAQLLAECGRVELRNEKCCGSRALLPAVTVRRIAGNRLGIGPIEAIDGTPVVDIKPVLAGSDR